MNYNAGFGLKNLVSQYRKKLLNDTLFGLSN